MFKPEKVAEVLREVVAEFGEDYVYPYDTCHYSYDGKTPACIVGQLVYKLDPELFTQLVVEEEGAGMLAADDSTTLEASFEPRVIQALTAAQATQDMKYTWGEALESFEQKWDEDWQDNRPDDREF
jgi:hypothetical protein